MLGLTFDWIGWLFCLLVSVLAFDDLPFVINVCYVFLLFDYDLFNFGWFVVRWVAV